MDSNYLLGYVCDPVTKRLAIDVLADHSGTVGGDADGIGQGRACRNPGTHLVQYTREPFHVGRGRGPGKSCDPVTELIAAPAHYPSIVGDAIREALICGYVRECAQFDQPPLVGIKEHFFIVWGSFRAEFCSEPGAERSFHATGMQRTCCWKIITCD